jgi:hypothetical protein
MVANGTRAPLVLLTLARKISSITLAVWKKGECYDNKKLKFMQYGAMSNIDQTCEPYCPDMQGLPGV